MQSLLVATQVKKGKKKRWQIKSSYFWSTMPDWTGERRREEKKEKVLGRTNK